MCAYVLSPVYVHTYYLRILALYVCTYGTVQYVLMHMYTCMYVRSCVHCHMYVLSFASRKCDGFIDTSPSPSIVK